MIPLDRWLQDRSNVTSGDSRSVEQDLPFEISSSIAHSVDDEDTFRQDMKRLAELEDALVAAQREREELKVDAVRRESQLIESLGSDLAVKIGHDIKEGLARIQHDIEHALVDVLIPFLGEAVSRKTQDELGSLIATTFANSSEPFLEVRAPAEFHPMLLAGLARAGLTASATESSTIDVLFPDQRMRFEELSVQWISLIEECRP